MRRKREVLPAAQIILIVLLTVMVSILTSTVVLPPIIKNSAWPLLVVLAVLLVGVSIWQFLHQKGREKIAQTLERHNRHGVLKNVRIILEQSFPQDPLIALELYEEKDAITSQQQSASGLPNRSMQELLPNTHIGQVYAEAGGKLLIL